jgi:hypothetical protein
VNWIYESFRAKVKDLLAIVYCFEGLWWINCFEGLWWIFLRLAFRFNFGRALEFVEVNVLLESLSVFGFRESSFVSSLLIFLYTWLYEENFIGKVLGQSEYEGLIFSDSIHY